MNTKLILQTILSGILSAAFIFFFASCSPTEIETPDTPSNAPTPKVVYHAIIISGFDSDPTQEQINGTSPRGFGNSGMFQLKGDLEEMRIPCSFFNWNGTPAGGIESETAPGAIGICKSMTEQIEREPETKFILVGHSWGGHTLLEVAEGLKSDSKCQIQAAFVIDPSSLMRGKRVDKLPDNIPSLVNYYTANAFCWGNWNQELVENIELGNEENGFSIDGHPNYGSALDAQAHTAAEWDQKIHGDISKRILELAAQK